MSIRRQATQGDLFALTDEVIHFNEVLKVIAINTEKIVGMFKDNKVAIAGDRISTIDHLTRSRSRYSGTFLEIYLYAFVNFLTLLTELVQNLSFGGPDKNTLARLGCSD